MPTPRQCIRKTCRNPKSPHSRTLCDDHLAIKRVAKKKREIFKRDNRLCIKCSSPASSRSIVYCDRCFDKARRYWRERVASRSALGVCRRCPNRVYRFGVTSCLAHARRDAERSKKRRSLLFRDGRCISCLGPTRIGLALCAACKEVKRAKDREAGRVRRTRGLCSRCGRPKPSHNQGKRKG